MNSEEVIPGIYQVKLPIPDSPLTYLNAYLVQENGGWLLVDTGWDTGEAFAAMEEQLAEFGVEFGDITQIVVTHCHPDHYGLAGKLKQLSGARLFLHQLEKDLIESRSKNMGKYLMEMAQWLQINGVPMDDLSRIKNTLPSMMSRMSFAIPDMGLLGGEIIPTDSFNFEVMWTPGHSLGHICLYEAERRILLSGDHILPEITPNVSLRSPSEGNPLGDYIRSLREISKLNVDVVLPAHGPVFRNLGERIEQILLHHKQRMAAISTVLEDGHKTGYQIASKIPWMEDTAAVSFDRLGFLERRMAVMETLAHLELLRTEGKVQRFPLDGVVLYGNT